ncbi:MAG TPA: cation diffusion facilitator family transporter [Jatrophihabitans sp.]|nr:cation diffusion facilitator family transporter [Jatrophihabitans sp.]
MAADTDTGKNQGSEESTLTVVLALVANLGVALLKLAAGLISGSGALLSEAAHSAGDSSTELLLLTALRRSERPADRVHPFGYGKERYFWSLIAAVTILVSGAAFSIYQGLVTIFGQQGEHGRLWINYPVLALAAILEAISFRQAIRQAKGAAHRGRRSVQSYLRDPDDPTVKSVVLEDSAALIGLLLAGVGVGLHQLTGNAVYDGIASLAIGLLLVFAAFALAQSCKGLLIGKQADPRMLQEISRRVEAEPEILDVVDLLTMMVGVNRVLLCLRVDVENNYTAEEIERACVRIDTQLRAEFSSLDEIFIQPVPRSDARLRSRVLHRYGRVLADEPDSEAGARQASRAGQDGSGSERGKAASTATSNNADGGAADQYPGML